MTTAFLRYRIKQLRKSRKPLPSKSYSDAQSVGIVFTVKGMERHNAVKQFISELKEDGKKVEVMTFLPESTENHEFLFDYFTKKDISITGRVKSQELKDFMDKPFDFLICVDPDPNEYLLFLLAGSPAACRVGRYTENQQPYFELMTAAEETPSAADFMRQLINLIKNLKNQ
ncbi:hypothetical protein AB9P05_23240 [Roseivirga sp. BDSF3-8]|uniref:DUF6913 domain-containing protein n=1 Tax=Roseivirga sp. BDSF3-8 TaxID=3241598 RepID=UPI0035323445